MPDRTLISPTPFPRAALRFMEVQVPRVIDGKTVFVITRRPLKKMIPFWIQWYIKTPWHDFVLARKCRRINSRRFKDVLQDAVRNAARHN